VVEVNEAGTKVPAFFLQPGKRGLISAKATGSALIAEHALEYLIRLFMPWMYPLVVARVISLRSLSAATRLGGHARIVSRYQMKVTRLGF
jgi:hypothetical protein